MKVIVKRGNKEFETEVKRAIELLEILEPGDICQIGKYTVERIGNQIYFKAQLDDMYKGYNKIIFFALEERYEKETSIK